MWVPERDEPKRGQDGDPRGHSSRRRWGALKAALMEWAENWFPVPTGRGLCLSERPLLSVTSAP